MNVSSLDLSRIGVPTASSGALCSLACQPYSATFDHPKSNRDVVERVE